MINTLSSPACSATRALTSRDSLPSSGARQVEVDERRRPGLLRRLMDTVIRMVPPSQERETKGLEWALIDTRGCDPGEYLIRCWTDANGAARRVERSERRLGGAIGLFTLKGGCVSAGPCPAQVDEGAGLLLMGFTHMMTMPLPRRGADTLGANWILVLGQRSENFSDPEIDRLLLLVWAISI